MKVGGVTSSLAEGLGRRAGRGGQDKVSLYLTLSQYSNF